MTEAADQRFAPPQAHVADVAVGGTELAGRGARLAAAIVDTVILFGVVWVVFLTPALRPLAAAQTKANAEGLWHWNFIGLAMGVAAFLVVQGWPLLTRGQTLGKMALKLRITRPDGSRPDAWRLLGLRYGIGMLMGVNPAISMVWGLVDSLLIFRGSRKCLHDTIADTQVIKL